MNNPFSRKGKLFGVLSEVAISKALHLCFTCMIFILFIFVKRFIVSIKGIQVEHRVIGGLHVLFTVRHRVWCDTLTFYKGDHF